MSDFGLLLKNNLNAFSPMERAPTSGWEAARLSLAAETLSAPLGVGNFVLGSMRDQRDDEFEKLFGTSIRQAVKYDWKPVRKSSDYTKQLEEYRAVVSDYIEQNRLIDPRFKDIKTEQELRAGLSQRRDEMRGEAAYEAAYSGVGGLVGSFAGGMAAAVLTDPVNLIATIGTGGLGTSNSILRTALKEGALNTGIEVLQVKSRKEWEESLGKNYGLKEAAIDITAATAGGMVLGGGLKALGKGVQYLTNRNAPVPPPESLNVLRTIEQNTLDPNVKDALKYEINARHILESNPVRNPDPNDVRVHLKNLDEYINAFIEKRKAVVFEPRLINSVDATPIARASNTAKLTEQNLDRIKTRAKENSIVVKESDFNSRQEADKFIRGQEGDRTDFIVENNDGVFSVYKIQKGEFLKNEDGSKKIFDKKAAATKRANKLASESGEAYSRVEIDGKNYVIKGDKEVAKKLEKSDISYEVNVTKDAEVEYKQTEPSILDSSNVKDPIRKVDLQTPDQVIKEVDEVMTAYKQTDVEAGFMADYSRALANNPDEIIFFDGQEITLKEFDKILKQDDDILDAVKGCAIG